MTKHYICIEYTYTIYNDILPVFRYTSIDIATIIYVESIHIGKLAYTRIYHSMSRYSGFATLPLRKNETEDFVPKRSLLNCNHR
jgi:hypothetical protein